MNQKPGWYLKKKRKQSIYNQNPAAYVGLCEVGVSNAWGIVFTVHINLAEKGQVLFVRIFKNQQHDKCCQITA